MALLPADGQVTTSNLNYQATRDIAIAINSLAAAISIGYAPAAAQYLVGATDSSLTAERLITDTASIAWDLTTTGVVKANVVSTTTTRVATQFDATTNVTLANVTGLSVTVLAATAYAFRAVLFINADTTGGQKIAVGGTATATSVIYNVQSTDNGSPGSLRLTSRQTALAGAAAQAGQAAYLTTIDGEIVVNAGGTLTVQFAQSVSSSTSSVLVGSTFRVWKVI